MKPIYKFCLTNNDKNFLPEKTNPKASGWDVKANLLKITELNSELKHYNALYKNGVYKDGENVIIRPGEYLKIPLGVKAFCPDGWWLELRPRSSTFGNKKLHSLYGVIDEDYEGELIFSCQYIPNFRDLNTPNLTIAHGDKIGQLVPVKRVEMEVELVNEDIFKELCATRNSNRGDKGFGGLSG